MKKTLFTSAILITAFLSLSSCVIRQNVNAPRTVEVNGTGEVSITNDTALIELSVITRNYDLIKASTENADKMTAVQKVLADKGINKTDISTSGYTVYQDRNYSGGKTVNGPYNVTNRIQISVNDVSKTGEIIDASIKAGANELNSVSYSPSNTESAVKQARILAVKNAEAKANTIATSSGNVLGQVLSIRENYSTYDTSVRKNAVLMESAASSTTPMNGGKTVVSVTVDATYQLD